MTGRSRIALIGSARHPIREPFAGGLEAHIWTLARALRQRGHEVTIYAGPGCDPDLDVHELPVLWPRLSTEARTDVSMPPLAWLEEHHAYLCLMLDLTRSRKFDVVHNNSLHHLPIAMASALPIPMVTTLHTPPMPWLESAIQSGPCPVSFVAVSRHTADAWRPAVTAQVIPNGIDVHRWAPGRGGGGAIWFGRLVPEKGAELAIAAAAAAGMELELVGPIGDPAYFARHVRPHLGPRTRYSGHLGHPELAARIGAASVTLVTPRWDEPYGLVVAESLACGTPVAAIARGGVAEILDPRSGVLVDGEDVSALARAAVRAASLSRVDARDRAVRHCSVTRMVEGYERVYEQVIEYGSAA